MAEKGKIGEAYLELRAKMDKFEAELKRAKIATGNASKSMQGALDQVEKKNKGLVKSLFSLRGALIAVGGTATIMMAKRWVEASNRQEQAIQRIRALLKAQGKDYQTLTPLIEKVTAAYQRKTTYGDEVQMEAMSKLLGITKNTQQAMKAWPLVMDLAAGAGMDLGAAAMYVGRAMEGQPEMLARYVPAIRNLAKEERTWANVQKILKERFAGVAEEMAKTPAGKVQQLANAWGDFQEKLGDIVKIAIIPFLNKFLKGINYLMDNWRILGETIWKLTKETFIQLGKMVWGFFTNRSVFEAGINLLKQFEISYIKIWGHTLELAGKIIARSASIIWAPLVKSLQWLSEEVRYYFQLGIERGRDAFLRGLNQITPYFVKTANLFIDAVNLMIGGAENFTNLFLTGIRKLKTGWDVMMKGIAWFAEHILRKKLPDWMTSFEADWEVKFGKIKKISEDALTFKIPPSTLKEPAKFTARMSEAWDIIKKQYAEIPKDLQKYVEDLRAEWDKITVAAGKFGVAVDWESYTKRISELVEKLKEGAITTEEFEKNLANLNKELEKTEETIKKLASEEEKNKEIADRNTQMWKDYYEGKEALAKGARILAERGLKNEEKKNKEVADRDTQMWKDYYEGKEALAKGARILAENNLKSEEKKNKEVIDKHTQMWADYYEGKKALIEGYRKAAAENLGKEEGENKEIANRNIQMWKDYYEGEKALIEGTRILAEQGLKNEEKKNKEVADKNAQMWIDYYAGKRALAEGARILAENRLESEEKKNREEANRIEKMWVDYYEGKKALVEGYRKAAAKSLGEEEGKNREIADKNTQMWRDYYEGEKALAEGARILAERRLKDEEDKNREVVNKNIQMWIDYYKGKKTLEEEYAKVMTDRFKREEEENRKIADRNTEMWRNYYEGKKALAEGYRKAVAENLGKEEDKNREMTGRFAQMWADYYAGKKALEEGYAKVVADRFEKEREKNKEVADRNTQMWVDYYEGQKALDEKYRKAIMENLEKEENKNKEEADRTRQMWKDYYEGKKILAEEYRKVASRNFKKEGEENKETADRTHQMWIDYYAGKRALAEGYAKAAADRLENEEKKNRETTDRMAQMWEDYYEGQRALAEGAKILAEKSKSSWQKFCDDFANTWNVAKENVIAGFTSLQDGIQGFMQSIISAWSSTISKWLKGALTFRDFMDRMFQNILNAFLDMVAQMIAQKMFLALFGPMPLAKGGMVLGHLEPIAPIPSAQAGRLFTKPTLAMVAEGGPERVLNPQETREYEQRRLGNTYITINAIDAKSFERRLRESPDTIVSIVNENIQRRGVLRR